MLTQIKPKVSHSIAENHLQSVVDYGARRRRLPRHIDKYSNENKS